MKRKGTKMNTIEEVRIKIKIKKLVHKMLKNMTAADCIESMNTAFNTLNLLPYSHKERFIDACLNAIREADEARRKRENERL